MSIPESDPDPVDEFGERLARVETKQDQLIEKVDDVADLEVPERLGSIETKQDTIVEKIDQVADHVDGRVSALEADIEQNEERTTKMYLGVRVRAWGAGSAGLLALGLSYAMF